MMMVSLQSQAQRSSIPASGTELEREQEREQAVPQDLRRVLPGGLDFPESVARDLCLGGIQFKAVLLAPSLSLPEDLVLESGIASCGCQHTPVCARLRCTTRLNEFKRGKGPGCSLAVLQSRGCYWRSNQASAGSPGPGCTGQPCSKQGKAEWPLLTPSPRPPSLQQRRPPRGWITAGGCQH